GCAADIELEINRDAVGDTKFHAALNHRLEAGGGDRYRIHAGIEGRRTIKATIIRKALGNHIALEVLNINRRSWHNRALRVGDSTADHRAGLLTPHGCNKQGECER